MLIDKFIRGNSKNDVVDLIKLLILSNCLKKRQQNPKHSMKIGIN
mgnify:CR=1 FL=1